MNDNFSLGDRIRELRTTCGLSQEQLALRASITPAYLGTIERGIKSPTLRTIEKLCNALDVSLAEFFSTCAAREAVLDEVCVQIVHQLDDKSIDEKQAILQLIKQVLRIQQMGNSHGT